LGDWLGRVPILGRWVCLWGLQAASLKLGSWAGFLGPRDGGTGGGNGWAEVGSRDWGEMC